MLYALTHLKVWAGLPETSKEAPLCMYIVRGCQMVSRMELCTFKVEGHSLESGLKSVHRVEGSTEGLTPPYECGRSLVSEKGALLSADSWVADKALQIFITLS